MVQARRQDFLRGGDIQRVDGPNNARGASLWGGVRGIRLPETAFRAF